MMRTAWSMASCGRWVNSLWSMAMSVSRPGESVARRAPGTSRSICARTRCMLAKLAARVAASCWYVFNSCSRLIGAGCKPFLSQFFAAGRRATAPFSATMESTGQVAAKGSLQPAGRPVMGMTCSPAAFRSASAPSASGVMAPSVVRVSSMSVRMPWSDARAKAGHWVSGCMKGNEIGRARGQGDPVQGLGTGIISWRIR